MITDPIRMYSLDELESWLEEFKAFLPGKGWELVTANPKEDIADLQLKGAKLFLDWVSAVKKGPEVILCGETHDEIKHVGEVILNEVQLNVDQKFVESVALRCQNTIDGKRCSELARLWWWDEYKRRFQLCEKCAELARADKFEPFIWVPHTEGKHCKDTCPHMTGRLWCLADCLAYKVELEFTPKVEGDQVSYPTRCDSCLKDWP